MEFNPAPCNYARNNILRITVSIYNIQQIFKQNFYSVNP